MIEILWRFCGGVVPNLSPKPPDAFELIALEIKGFSGIGWGVLGLALGS